MGPTLAMRVGCLEGALRIGTVQNSMAIDTFSLAMFHYETPFSVPVRYTLVSEF